MASQLREVLNRFTDQSEPVSVNRMAHEMGIEPGVLSGMIDYWVRKGKLRAVSAEGKSCNTCGVKGACPFVVAVPRCYELAAEHDTASDAACACGCSHCG